jgi:hypothetical protein
MKKLIGLDGEIKDAGKMARLMKATGNEFYQHPGGVIQTAEERILACPTYLRKAA